MVTKSAPDYSHWIGLGPNAIFEMLMAGKFHIIPDVHPLRLDLKSAPDPFFKDRVGKAVKTDPASSPAAD